MIRHRSSKTTAIVIILASSLVSVPSITKARNAVIHTIPVGVFPTHMVASPDGSRIYVVNQGGPGADPNTERNNRGSLSVIDASGSTATVTTPFDVGFPIGLASTPDGSRIYVAISSYLGNVQTTGSPRVEVIDTATNTIAATIRAPGTEPTEVAITPDGFRVYVTNRGTGTVLVINTANNVMQGSISAGPEPFGIAITADGRRAYVVLRAQGVVKVIDVDPTSPTFNTVIDTIDPRITGSNSVSSVTITPDGARAYVTFSPGENQLAVIRTATNAVELIPTSGNGLTHLAFSPAGAWGSW